MTQAALPIGLSKRAAIAVVLVPIVLLALLCVHALCVVPDFEYIFERLFGSNSSLPAPTRLVMRTYRFWFLFPLALVATVVDFARRSTPTGRHALVLLFTGSVLVLLTCGLLMMGLYSVLVTVHLPLMRM